MKNIFTPIILSVFILAAAAHNCIQLKSVSNGAFYGIKNSGNSYWSTSELVFTLQNVCTDSFPFKNFKVLLENWLVNGSPATGAYMNQVGSPYLSSSLSSVAEGVQLLLNSPDCSSYCDWANLKPNTEISFIVTLGVSGVISTSDIKSIKLMTPHLHR